MASDAINGNYAAHNGLGYEATEQYDSHKINHSASATTEYSNPASTSGNSSNVPKDEVGWYFVEQYYTTLSKSPEKLFLFYNKQSQFVSGTEAEKVSVCVGQKAINDRIRELDFEECKVRVTNVDSQGSRSNIVIQVIGEISNKQQPLRKFTQTFVLAEQANGYFVLNDIFRYIVEEEDYEEEEQRQPEQQTSTQQETASVVEPAIPQISPPAAQTTSVSKATAVEPAPSTETPAINGITSEDTQNTISAEEVPATVESNTTDAQVASEVADTTKAEEKQVEEIAAAAPSKPAAATAAASAPAPAKPSGPKTWANIAGGNRIAPAIPASTTSAAPAAASASKATTGSQPAQAQPPTPTAPSAMTAAATTAPISAPQELERSGTPGSASEWQTAGHEHSRKQSKFQGGNQTPVENSRGYIKAVTETVEEKALEEALKAVAQVVYFDVARAKNCAFVDFATPAEYRAAVAANPYEVNGQRLYVEERRVRPFANGGFTPRGGMRGNRGGPASGQQRGGMPKDGQRGGAFGGNRGRGGFRGRGGATPVAPAS